MSNIQVPPKLEHITPRQENRHTINLRRTQGWTPESQIAQFGVNVMIQNTNQALWSKFSELMEHLYLSWEYWEWQRFECLIHGYLASIENDMLMVFTEYVERDKHHRKLVETNSLRDLQERNRLREIISQLEGRNKQLEEELTSLQDEESRLRQQLNTLTETTSQHTKENQSVRECYQGQRAEVLERLEPQLYKLAETSLQLRKENQSVRESSQEQRTEVLKSIEDLRAYHEKECRALMATTDINGETKIKLEELEKAHRQLQEEHEKLSITYTKAREENREKEEALDALQNRKLELEKAHIKLQEEHEKKLASTYTKAEEENRKKEEELDTLRNRNVERDKAYRQLQEQHRTLSNSYSTSLEDTRKKNEELDALRNRLSKMAGAMLLHGNANIADLSDENRPTKLSEKYSELYDNEWTDAIEELTDGGQSEEECIATLLDILTETHLFCQDLSQQYYQRIVDVATNIDERPHGNDANDVDVERQKQIKDLRKGFSSIILGSVMDKCESKRSSSNDDLGANVRQYIRKCAELCWLMSVQDPPVVIDDWDQEPGVPYNSDIFRHYTRIGNALDYVVWPPLYLTKGGTLLGKGVAQAKKKSAE